MFVAGVPGLVALVPALLLRGEKAECVGVFVSLCLDVLPGSSVLYVAWAREKW